MPQMEKAPQDGKVALNRMRSEKPSVHWTVILLPPKGLRAVGGLDEDVSFFAEATPAQQDRKALVSSGC